MSQFKNPFDPANFTSGGGLWDGKVVTITGSKAVLSPMKNGDGSPVLGDEDLIRLLVEATIEHQIEVARRPNLGKSSRRRPYPPLQRDAWPAADRGWYPHHVHTYL